jgi:hypothetical protein
MKNNSELKTKTGVLKSIIFVILLSSCASGILREDSEMSCFPTAIDIHGWKMTSAPKEIPVESVINRKNGALSSEYKTDKIISCEYERVDENSLILFEVWHAKTPLDAYSMAKRYSMKAKLEYKKDSDIFISDTASCFSRGNYFFLIDISSGYVTSRGEILKASLFASDKIHATGEVPRYATLFGSGITFFRNPSGDISMFHDFFEGRTVIQGRDYHTAFFVRDSQDEADRDFSDILRRSVGAVVTDFSDIRAFFVSLPDKRFSVFSYRENIVICILDASSIDEGKEICNIVFQSIVASIPRKRS